MALSRAQIDNDQNSGGVVNARKISEQKELKVKRQFYDEERNVDYLRRGANDNQQSIQNAEKISSEGLPPANQNRRVPKSVTKMPAINQGSALKGVAKIAAAAEAVAVIIPTTVWLYLMQLPFAVLSIISFGGLSVVEDSWWGSIVDLAAFGTLSDFGLGMAFFSMIVTFICGFITLLTALAIFMVRGVRTFRGVSLIIMALCVPGYIFPVFSLVPWAWLWCAYIVIASRKGG